VTGYAAIGSGDIFPYFALTGLRHYGVANRSMLEAKLIAVRILDDVIHSAAFGIGPPSTSSKSNVRPTRAGSRRCSTGRTFRLWWTK
jgi:hypothetical protein